MTLDNLAGMGWERPLLGAAMWTFMLSFAGLPPTGGLGTWASERWRRTLATQVAV